MRKEYIIAGAAGVVVIGGIIFGIVKFTGKSDEQVVTNGDIQVVQAVDSNGAAVEEEDPNAGELDIMVSDDYDGDLGFLTDGDSADSSTGTNSNSSGKSNTSGQGTPVTVVPVTPATGDVSTSATSSPTSTGSSGSNNSSSGDRIIEENPGAGNETTPSSSFDASEGMVYETERIPVL